MLEMLPRRVGMIGGERATAAHMVGSRRPHEMIDGELAAAAEQFAEGAFALGSCDSGRCLLRPPLVSLAGSFRPWTGRTPMASADALYVASTIDQIAVCAVGLAIAWMGYRLFRTMPTLHEGQAKLGLPGGVSIYFSRIGPGAFFVLFGTGLIAYTIAHRPLSYSAKDGAVAEQGFGDRSVAGTAVASAAAPAQPRPELVRALADLAKENAATPLDQRHFMRDAALRAARVQVMLSPWDKAWGDKKAFLTWVNGDPDASPPESARGAAAVFLGQ
jgi:hypothetical protein